MSTGMSTKRSVIHAESGVGSGTAWSLIGLVGGAVVFLLGMSYSFTPALIVGFMSFVLSFLYLNAMFWARVFDKHHIGQGTGMSRIMRM